MQPMTMCDAAEILVADAGATCGTTVLYLPETASSQDVARELILHAAAGTAVVAGYQTSGRGTQGRDWLSPPGVGVHLSVLVSVPGKPEAIPWLTPAAAIATAQALRGLTSVPPRLKWPNDVLLGGLKVAGVLTEIPAGSALAVVGIGVNVHAAPPDIGATALAAWALHPVERNAVASRVLRELDHLLSRLLAGRLDHVKEAWRLLLDTVGSQVSVERDGQVAYGRATAVDGSGALIVKTATGGTIRVSAGSGALVRHTG